MADQPTDESNKPALNVPRMASLTEMSPVPPGMGELNYIQTLLAGIIDQTLYTTSSVTFAGMILSGLTASLLVGTSATKALQSISVGTSLSLSGTTLNAIQGIRTADSPSFTGLTVGSLAGILKAAAGVVAAATIGTSLDYTAPTLNAIQDIRTSARPLFAGVDSTISAGSSSLFKLTVGSTSVTAQAQWIRGTTITYVGPWSGGEWHIWSNENIPFVLGLNNAEVFRITAAGLINPKATTSIGLINPAQTFHLRLICGSALLADRNLTFTPGDAARTITLSGNPTLADWFDQAVKAASSPTLAGLTLTAFSGFVKATTGILSAAALASGDIPSNAANTSGTAGNLSGPAETSNTRKFLMELSVGGVFQSPVWDYPIQADVTGLKTTDSPVFVTTKLSGLTDGYIPYHVDDNTGLANGPTKTDVDSAVSLKHAAVTVSAPIALSTQALSLINNAVSPAAVTAIDVGALANSDTVIPTSKAVTTAIAAGGGMVYPGAGIPISTGAAWGTSVANDTSNARKFLRELSVAGVFATPAWDTLLAADIPDLSSIYRPIGGGSSTLPTFLVATDESQQNIAVNTYVQIIFQTEIKDQGNNFASNVFTAPVTGMYQLNAVLYFAGYDASQQYYLRLTTSNRNYWMVVPPDFSFGDGPFTAVMSNLCDMDTGDTAQLHVHQVDGTQQTDINASYFSGFLAC